MSGVHQQSLFGKQFSLPTVVSECSRYRVLANILPWIELADVANYYRSLKVDVHNGRKLDLRMHIGAYIAQSMNGWTDRATEEMVKYHAGVRILCGLEESTMTTDRTSIEDFRNMLGKDGSEVMNQLIVQHAAGAGFTGSELCAANTTVQESPLAYPTEVGHMKNIADKPTGIGQKLNRTTREAINKLHGKVHFIDRD